MVKTKQILLHKMVDKATDIALNDSVNRGFRLVFGDCCIGVLVKVRLLAGIPAESFCFILLAYVFIICG